MIPYHWKKVAQTLEKHGIEKSLLGSDLRRIADSFYGPITSPSTPQPRCLIVGDRSGLETAFIKENYPLARIFVLDLARSQRSTGVIYIDSLAALRDHIGDESIDFCRVDETWLTDELINSLLKSCIKIRYLAGAAQGLFRSAYQLHRDLSLIAEKFHVHLIRDGGSLSSSNHHSSPYVSVIVPAYGVEKYLPQCLESLCKQTLDEIEIIVVDDGAKDRSGEIADHWAASYPGKLKVIHKANGGCASARNAGLQVASGLYVGFVDGDDWVSPNMFEDLITAVLPGMKDVGQCGFVKAYEEGGEAEIVSEPPFGAISFPYETSHKPDYINNAPQIWRRIYRRNFLEKYEIDFNENLKRFDDLPFNYLALSLATSVVVIPEAHYFYRLGRPGQDVSFSDERLFIHFEIFDYLRGVINDKFDGSIGEYLPEIESATHNWALSFLREDLRDEYRNRMDQSARISYTTQ